MPLSFIKRAGAWSLIAAFMTASLCPALTAAAGAVVCQSGREPGTRLAKAGTAVPVLLQHRQFLHKPLNVHGEQPPPRSSSDGSVPQASPSVAATATGASSSSSAALRGAEPSSSDSSSANSERYDILIVIPSAAQELSKRDAIRESWTRYLTSERCVACKKHRVGYRFVVGNESDLAASEAEAKSKGDLAVLKDFGQPVYYKDRSEKTLRSIRYAVENTDFRFLLKVDTDSWPYLDRLLRHFDDADLWEKSRLYAGNFQEGKGASAIQDSKSKWFDPVFPEVSGGTHQYPQHAIGAGYVLSRELAEDLAKQPSNFWQDLPCEDTAIGFWLYPLRKEVVPLKVSKDPACDNGDVVIDHHVNPDFMRKRWHSYEASGSPC